MSIRVKRASMQKFGAKFVGSCALMSAAFILTTIITIPAHATINCAGYLPNSYFERIENTPPFAGTLVQSGSASPSKEPMQQLQNAAGKVVLDNLTDAYILMDRYLLAKQYGKYGVANAAGEIIIPFEYDDIQTEPDIATSFIVSLNSPKGVNKQGIINREGAWIYPLADADIQHAHYDSAHDQDYFIVTENSPNDKRLNGLLNDKGEWAVLPQYDAIQPLNACTGKPLYLQVKRQDKTALIDQNNDVIIPFADNQHIELFNDYNAVPLFLRSTVIEGSSAEGMSEDIEDDIMSAQIIDAHGKLRLASDAPIHKLLYHQLFAYKQAGKYGFIDDKIKVVLAPQFESYRDEADKVWVEKRGKMRQLKYLIKLD